MFLGLMLLLLLLLCLVKVLPTLSLFVTVGKLRHSILMQKILGLLSLCPCPAGLPEWQGLAMGQQNPQHPCTSPVE